MSLTARVAPPRYLLGQALHAEWTKFRTVAGPAWLLAGVVALTVAVAVAAASVAQCQSAKCGIDPATVSFTGIYPGQAVVAVAGVLAIGNEYSTGMIKLSLTAVPRRLTWLFAKAAVLAAPVLAGSVLAVAGAALAGRLILPGHGFTPAHRYASLTSATPLSSSPSQASSFCSSNSFFWASAIPLRSQAKPPAACPLNFSSAPRR